MKARLRDGASKKLAKKKKKNESVHDIDVINKGLMLKRQLQHAKTPIAVVLDMRKVSLDFLLFIFPDFFPPAMGQ